MIPNPWSRQLAASRGADQYLLPFFVIEGVPVLHTAYPQLREGMVWQARVRCEFGNF